MLITTATTLRNNLSDSIFRVTKGKEPMLVARRGKIDVALISTELLEDLLALTDSDYLASIRQAREEFERGDVLSHDQVFGDI